jgi:hypothetical protein
LSQVAVEVADVAVAVVVLEECVLQLPQQAVVEV